MKGFAIAGPAILHVFLAQFAIGGGMLLCYFEWLSQTGRVPNLRKFVDGYFKVLVLISFVVGALTGVGIWFGAIQVSPRTIGLMVHEFNWVWGIEWTFFSLEMTSGYAFYRYGSRLNNQARLLLLALYSVASWFSLFWINGILSWQLTPGGWIDSEYMWYGFFNPSFWPSVIFRTVTAMTIAALTACVVINAMPNLTREERTTLINRAAHFLWPMTIMPVLAVWYFGVIPGDSRSWVFGGDIAMTLFMGGAVGASVLIGAYSVFGLIRQKLYINGATATLLVALAFAATAGGEFVREGVRKPYTVRNTLYSNSLKQTEVERLRLVGSVTSDPYPLRRPEQYPSDQVRLGAKVYRFQCSVCHTIDGANALTHLTGSWKVDQKRMNIAKLQHTKPFMPPFAGNAQELEALVQFLNWHTDGCPDEWQGTNNLETLAQIQDWLDEAGTGPGANQTVHK